MYDGKVVNPVQFNDFMDDIASAASRYLRMLSPETIINYHIN